VTVEDPGACGARVKELAAPEARGSHVAEASTGAWRRVRYPMGAFLAGI
jgi:hypothetical protein